MWININVNSVYNEHSVLFQVKLGNCHSIIRTFHLLLKILFEEHFYMYLLFMVGLTLTGLTSWLSDLLYWSSLKPGNNVPAHRSTMPQLNMIPQPANLN